MIKYQEKSISKMLRITSYFLKIKGKLKENKENTRDEFT